MASTSLNPHHHQPLARRHHFTPLDSPSSSSSSSVAFSPSKLPLQPCLSSSHLLTPIHSLPSSNPTTTSTTTPNSFDLLQHQLSSQNFRLADEETRRLLILLAGESAQKRKYVFFSEVQLISAADLLTIDSLWRHHSNSRFGYSVQKRLWEKARRDFTNFFLKVGWMKKLETEMEQYNYRSFPNEFIWELKDDTPEGHLPLTNALRGTQLLNSILTHPAFESVEGDEEEADMGLGNLFQSPKPMNYKNFKPDYSF